MKFSGVRHRRASRHGNPVLAALDKLIRKSVQSGRKESGWLMERFYIYENDDAYVMVRRKARPSLIHKGGKP